MMAKTIDVSELYPGYNGYVIYKDNRYYVTIPKNIDESTASVCGFGYGGGGRSDNDNAIEYQKNHAADVNTIGIYPNHEPGTTIDGFMNTSGGQRAYVGLAKEIIKQFGLNDNAFVSTGSSSSARAALLREYEYLMRNEDVTGGYAIMIEPADDKSWSNQLSKNTIDDDLSLKELVATLNEHEVTTIVFRANDMESDIQKSIDMGLEVLDIHVVYRKSDNKESNLKWLDQHGITCALFGASGLGNIHSGSFNFNNLPTKYDSYNITYDIGYYSNGIYHPLTITQANEIIGVLGNNNLSNEDIIQSDNAYLSQNLTSIKSLIKSAKLNDLSIEGYGSTTSVPSKESSIIYKMIASSNKLLDKIGKEIVTIGAIGDKFANMDNLLEDEALKIGMEVTSDLLPEVKLHNYENKDSSNIVSTTLLQELETLKNQINSNSEDNPLIENDMNSNVRKTTISTKPASTIPLSFNEHRASSVFASSSGQENLISQSSSNLQETADMESSILESTSSVASKTSVSQNKVKTTSNTIKSDDSYRETIKQEWGKELFPKPSNKKEKTPISPSNEQNVVVKNYSDKIVTSVDPDEPKLPEKPVIPVEPVEPREPKPIVPDNPVVPDDPIDPPTDNSELYKTIGLVAGLGTGIGTVAYGINNEMGKRELRDGYDYSYEKEVSTNDYLEQESLEEQYSPYVRSFTDDDNSDDIKPYQARKIDVEEEENE